MFKNILVLSGVLFSLAARAQSFHTISIDGNNDFNSTNERLSSTSGTAIYSYVTWDKTYLYVGLSGSTPSGSITDNDRIYHLYIDTDPNKTITSGAGTTDGETWRWDPTLPFTANYHYVFKTASNQEFKKVFSNGQWNEADILTSNYKGNGYWELRIRLSDLGSPKQINLLGYVEEDWTGGTLCGGFPSQLFTNTTTQGAITFNSKWLNYYLIDQINPSGSFHLNNFNWLANISASVNTLKDTAAYAGMAINATNGYDAGIDLPKPPTPPSNYIEVYFPHSDWTSVFGNNYLRDFKTFASLDSTTQSWSFSVNTDQANATITLTVDDFDFIPSNYNIKIKDLTNDSLHNVKTLGSYQYNSGSAARSTRNFYLIIGVSLSSQNIQASVSSLSYGAIKTNKDSTKSFTVTNTGDSLLIISNIKTSNSVFTFDGGTTDTLVINEVRTINVKFKPIASHVYNDTLSITSNDGDTPVLRIMLSGTGVTLQPNISSSANALSFGSVKVTKDTTLSFKVYNTGDTTLAVTSIVSTNSAFTLTTASSFTVNASDSQTVSVKFSPTSASTYSESLRIISSDPDTLNISLSGTGIALQPNISVTPATLNFGNVKVDYTSSLNFVVKNIGETALNVTNIVSGSSVFAFTGSTSFSLAVDSSKTLSVTFKPKAVQSYNSTLTITSNDPDTANYPLQLSGNGITGNYENIFTAGWNLMSIPVRADNQLASAVIGDDASSFYLYSYSNSGGYLNEDSLLTAHGYWLGLPSIDTIDVSGTPEVDTIQWHLAKGWNIVSNPFVRNYKTSSIHFKRGSAVVNSDSASQLGWIQNAYYGYTNSSGSYFGEDTLKAWSGYWFSTLTDSVKLFFYHDSTIGNPLLKIQPDEIKIDEHNWFVSISLNSQQISDEQLFFGVAEGASDGFDNEFDFAKPPLSPRTDAIQSYFYYPQWNNDLKFFMSDIKAPFTAPAPGKSWEFKIYSRTDGQLILSWLEILNQLPQQIFDNYEFILSGVGILAPMNMKNIQQHSFNALSGIEYSFVINAIPTSIEDGEELPKDYFLSQNYPNPFNPSTKIQFIIPNVETLRATSVHLSLKVFDILGNEIATLANEEKEPGNYQVVFSPATLASGTYFYELKAGDFTARKKMIFLK